MNGLPHFGQAHGMVRWQGPRGSFDHPQSALTLRLVLAGFGVVFCGALALVAAWQGMLGWAWLLGALAVIALVDLIVIQYRRRAP
jgi:hypothetical protein